MKRDFDLIRSILIQVEDAPAGPPLCQLGAPEGVSADTLIEHLKLMIDEGLIEGEVVSASQCVFFIYRLTWKGHDFLATAKSDTAWSKVMKQAKEKGVALTVTILSSLLTKEAMHVAGLGDIP